MPTLPQSAKVVLFASGFEGEAGLRDGVHLCWHVQPTAGFPELGFDLYRRAHRPGTPRELRFDGESPRELPASAQIGATRWETQDYPPLIVSIVVAGTTYRALRPGRSALSCRFDPAEGLVRRIELDIVHRRVQGSQPPVTFSLWGIAGNFRVVEGKVELNAGNAGSVLTVAVQGDALEGFQVWADRFDILDVRWVLVSDEAELGWGAPLNPRRIGFPLTAPGYAVKHAHWPDLGLGQQDWEEAADRLAMNESLPLPAARQSRFGLPRFQALRTLMRAALNTQEPLRSVPVSAADPELEMSAVEVLSLLALDADLARIAGLAWRDATAVAGVRYDYRIVMHGGSRPTLRWVCSDDPEPPPGTDGTPDDATGPEEPGAAPGVTTGVTLVPLSASQPRMLHFRRSVPSLVALEDATLPALRLSGIGTGARKKSPPIQVGASSTSTLLTWPAPVERFRVTLHDAGRGGGIVVLALRQQEVVAVRQISAATEAVTVDLGTTGLTGAIVVGIGVVVTRWCRLELGRSGAVDGWIAFDVRRGPAPPLAVPPAPRGQALPAFPRAADTAASTPVGLWLVERPATSGPFDLFPLAIGPRDAIRREILRRHDGDAAVADAAPGPWQALPIDADGIAMPIALGHDLPEGHRMPEGWPVDEPNFVDGSADPTMRFITYRQRGVDVFGRRSAWSGLGAVDAADRFGPPPPDLIAAGWIDASQPGSDSEDLVLLLAQGVTAGVRVAWRWRPQRQQQSPDTAAFRVYWHGSDFDNLAVDLSGLQTVHDEIVATLALPAGTGSPATDALAGDWLRQGARQYLVRSSSSATPTEVHLAASGQPPPRQGGAVLQLRAPDPQRLDLLGSPLRRDRGDALMWDERVLQLPRADVSGALSQVVTGMPLQVDQVIAVQDGRWRVTIGGGWVGADLPLPGNCRLQIGAAIYPIIGERVARQSRLVIDATGQPSPVPGAALLLGDGTTLVMLSLEVTPVVAARGDLRGGVLQALVAGTPEYPVWAHRFVGTRIDLITSASLHAGDPVRWWPDYEVLLTQRPWSVSATRPDAVASVGVSAIDARTYRPDRRVRPGEPSSPGNEGTVTARKVLRRHLGAPGAAPSLAGISELWSSVPAPFSGVSRYVLRWAAQADAAAYVVWRASLAAVLDADADDRAAARGAYVGQPPLDAVARQEWRALQSERDAAALQVLADAQVGAFKAAHEQPLTVDGPMLVDAGGGLRWHVPLDGSAPGRWFLRLQALDAAGHAGPLGPASAPIRVPDVRRPAAPPIRPARPADRSAWIAWESTEPDGQFTVLRAGDDVTASDVASMAVVASGAASAFPEPLTVSAGTLLLPGAAPAALVALYLAEDYDTARAPDAQTAAPLADVTALAVDLVSGITSVDEGARLFAAVRRVAGGPVQLAVSASGCAWLDRGLSPDQVYRYRVRVRRTVPVSATNTLALDSPPSALVEVRAFDARPLVPPPLQLAWEVGAGQVRIDWPVAGLDAGLQVRIERTPAGLGMFSRVLDWSAASAGTVADASVTSGQAYEYRLRVRSPDGRESSGEPLQGPLQIP